ncbi:hypothetical protein COHA_000300 [Chlorella ohadii]|nr:hypothetical protein COHA_000300 [Chlorella ohadii]
MASNHKGMLPVHTAAAEGTAAVLQLLLVAVADGITAVGGEEGMQPIHCAAAGGNTAAVELLLASRPELATAVDNDGWTAAHYAARIDGDGLPALQLLIAAAPQGSCHSAQDVHGWLPAHVAAQNNCPAALKHLFASAPAAAQALAIEHDAWVPLHLAAQDGSVAAAEVLLEVAPEACQIRNAAGRTPLSVAAWNGQEGMVSLLLAAAPQAALRVEDDSGALPIHGAARQGHAGVVAALLAAHPESATALLDGAYTPLDMALLFCEHPDQRDRVALVLLPAGPAELALDSLIQAGPASQHLLPDFVAARLPLNDALWARLLSPCAGLGRVLPAALEHGTEQAQQLVRHLPAADAARLRLAALCLARSQRRTSVHLPPAITGLLLALSCG